MRGGSASSTTQLTAFEAEHIARLLEERNIHSLYRLLARVVQLLNLMSLLRRAQEMVELREIDWGLLHGLTIAQLVQTSEGQERLESLLNSLVTSSASDRSQMAVQSAHADQLASLFADQCYLFFSPGSRFAYLGLRKANEALVQPISSSSRISLADQASQHLRQAAQHWYSAPLITGRILHTKGKETFRQIALRAMQYGSPLAKAVEALMELKDVANVVHICLITAANFKSDRATAVRSAEPLGAQRNYELSWEHNLYHKRRDGQENDSRVAASVSSTQSSPSQIIAYGTEVTSRDAIDTCYSLIFYHLSMLLNSKSDLAYNMISACAAASDITFLETLYSYLLESDHADTLLRINSPTLDKWLGERKDPDLLWRYYNVQRRHQEAGRVALEKASDAIRALPLSERIEWLSRSLTSYKSALEEGQQRGLGIGSNEDIAAKNKEVTDSLHLARLQNRILASVDSSRSDEMTAERRNRLANFLVPVSELYNDFAAFLSMFEECLLILHACRHDDARTIQALWKNIFCEELLPCSTRSETVHHFLQTFVADLGLGDQINFLSETEQSDSLRMFEDGFWEKPLIQRIVDLGKELYGTGANYVFPVDFILFSMEGKLYIYLVPFR
jgi:nuclear pore complex protein Nup155